jgi:hypothetical protein
MQRLEASGAVRDIYITLVAKGLNIKFVSALNFAEQINLGSYRYKT